MTRQLVAGLALLLLVPAGCTAPPQPQVVEPPRGYSSEDLHVSFHVPTGWTAAGSWKPIQAAPKAVRFESPSRESMITLAYGSVGELNCSAAARAALLSVSGSVLRAVRAFELPTAPQKTPAGSGETSGADSQGMARYFCAGGMAVVVDAAATKASFSAHFGELQDLLDSVTYEDRGQRITVEAPPGTPPGRSYFTHVVRFRGETLARIARWYTGTYNTWREIALANEDITSPNRRLKVHTEVKIPLELVVRETAFPQPPRASPRPKIVKEAPAKEEAAEPKREVGAESQPLPPVIGPR